jgi:hypothetical protein
VAKSQFHREPEKYFEEVVGLDTIKRALGLAFSSPAMRKTLFLVCVAWSVQAQSPPVLEVGKFSAAQEGIILPDPWKPLTFPKIDRHTIYTVTKEEEVTAIKAVSQASASGLTREINVDLNEYPILSWRWKVLNVLNKADVTRKQGDDYPARIYVTFGYDPRRVGFLERTKFETYKLLYGRYPPLAALNYIWESKAPKGTIVSSPYTDRSKLIVVESGTALINQWIDEHRNIFEDYKKAFGNEPPSVSGVAIMTDTDNTGESAVAYYGDIVFKMSPTGPDKHLR